MKLITMILTVLGVGGLVWLIGCLADAITTAMLKAEADQQHPLDRLDDLRPR